VRATEAEGTVAEPRGKRRTPDVLVTLLLVPVVLYELIWRYRWRLVILVAFVFVIAYPPRGLGR
jgi:hypothetical protein